MSDAKHEFLSEAWFDAAAEVRQEVGDDLDVPSSVSDLKMNVTVTDAPGGEAKLHMAGSNLARGHLDDAPTRLTLDYDLAKKVLASGDLSAAMQAFMAGQMKLEGDMSKVMALQTTLSSPTDKQREVQDRLKAITA